MNRGKLLLVLLFWVATYSLAQAQFNISVNYSLGYVNASNYDNIIETYNTRQDSLKIGFDGLGLLNAIGLGARYRYRFAALEFTWLERFKRGDATGVLLEGRFSSRELGYRYRTFALTYTTFISDNLSFGGSINLDRFTMNTETSGELARNFMNETMYSSRFFIGLNTEISDSASLSLQPFVTVPWGSFDFSDLNDKLNPGISVEDTKEDMLHFGISIIIYNGEQY